MSRTSFQGLHPNLVGLITDVATVERHGVTPECCVPIWQIPAQERPQQIEGLVKLSVDPAVSLSEARNALLIAGIMFGSSPYGEMNKLFVNQVGSSDFADIRALALVIRDQLAQDCAKGPQSRLLTSVLGDPSDLSPNVRGNYAEKVLPEICLNLLYPTALLTGGSLNASEIIRAYSAQAVEQLQKPKALDAVRNSFGFDLSSISPEAVLQHLSCQTNLLSLQGSRPGGQIFEAYYCAWILAAQQGRATDPLAGQH
jgi:hypothetical protein